MQILASNETSTFLHDENSQAPEQRDYASRIRTAFMEEDGSAVPQLLTSYSEAGYPDYKAYEWYDWLKEIGNNFASTSSSGVLQLRQERAQLLLGCLGGTQRHALLNIGINEIKRDKRDQRIALPQIDNTRYFAVYEILRGDPEIAFWSPGGKRPAILTAAQSRFLNVLVYAIEQLEEKIRLTRCLTAEEVKDQVLSRLNVSDISTNTLLGFAVQNSDTEMVSMLLGRDARLADERYLNDIHIKRGLSRGAEEIIKNILTARPDLARSLPKLIVMAGGSHCFNMWEAFKSHFEQHLDCSDDILHLAVQEGQLGIIDWLVREYPEMATRKDNGKKIALSYNNDQALYCRDKSVKEKIRKSIVPAIVRLQKPADSQKLLLDADDTPQQTCLDLSLFNPSTHDFAHFIDLVKDDLRARSLGNEFESACDLKFESILRYVQFPDLSQMSKPKGQSGGREEVPDVLEWLRRKEITTILKLNVPDCMSNPLDEGHIRISVRNFGIEELNWRRLDLCIEPIMGLAPTLSVLHLYSSGNWAALSHWVSEYGVRKLENLKEVHIVVVEDCMTAVQAEECAERTKTNMTRLKSVFGWKCRINVRKAPWSRHSNSPVPSPKEGRNYLSSHDTISASTSIGIEEFISGYRDIQQARLQRNSDSDLKPLRKIKVALIDTGIVAIEDRKSDVREFQPGQIKEGISFVHGADGESESPWWLPSHEHGSQMADIICSIDPYCELYPAKVANGTSVKGVPSVVDAIDWAIKRDVDIISLSLVLFNSNPDLFAKVQKAASKDIVIICSTADQGNNHQKVYPATYWKKWNEHCLFPIAACDQYGKLTAWSTETEAKYHFRGKDVNARPVRFIKEKDSNRGISGSSVATAIAAGTASLTLACCLLALDDEVVGRRQRVEHFFQRMQTEESREASLKYIEPSILLGEDSVKGNVTAFIMKTFALKI